jgi:chloramphenicol 3-O phosphotransferase
VAVEVGVPGRVILLNGPPSCGKTTLARAMLPLLGGPWFHRSLDDFRAGYLERYWREDDGSLFARVLVGYLGALRAMALAGNNVVAEAVVTPDRTQLYADAFKGLPVVLVGVTCALTTAVEREHTRRDRLGGPLVLPADAFAAVHAGFDYDVEVDTTTGTPQTLASAVVNELPVAPRDGPHFNRRVL